MLGFTVTFSYTYIMYFVDYFPLIFLLVSGITVTILNPAFLYTLGCSDPFQWLFSFLKVNCPKLCLPQTALQLST